MASEARIVVHADESCLGNGREGDNPGGAGGLVEIARGGEVSRRDYFVAESATTNNRMALRSAITALELLGVKGRSLALEFVSDSSYLVKGMSEWVPSWRARGWRRKGGELQNLELWQELSDLAEPHDIRWRWVRGHADDPRNAYADYLATKAARDQVSSDGLVESGYAEWLAVQRAKGLFL
jgi:ribonuclease HI